MKSLLLGTVAALAVAAPAQAAVTFYTSLSAFNAATTGGVTDGFEIAAPGNAVNLGTTGYAGAGFTITSPQSYLFSVDPAYSPTFYDWGSGDTMLFQQNGAAVFSFASPVTAFGLDLMSILSYGATITVSGAGFSQAVVTSTYPTRTFFGLTSTTGITGFTLQASGGFGEFDNFVIASANAGIPEPAAWAMMLAGFGLVGGAMRRREKMTVTYA